MNAPIFGMSHSDAVALWHDAESVFFLCFVIGLCLISAEQMRWRAWGLALALTTWIGWIVAYDVAKGFRNVNQVLP